MDNSASETLNMQQRFAEIFSRVPERDIEQFYAHYQLWVLRHRIPILTNQIEELRAHALENQNLIKKLQPPSIALAVLARLQSHGVNDVNLLDQMLARGESWLDQMMQRLDYCEQVEDFIQGNYTQWCIHSLEGAYDWIDSLRENPQDETTEKHQTASPFNDADVLLTEELLLQKLSIDDEEAMLEATLQPPVTNQEPSLFSIDDEEVLLETTLQPPITNQEPSLFSIDDEALLEPSLISTTKRDTSDGPTSLEEPLIDSEQAEMLALFLNREDEIEPDSTSAIPVELTDWQPLESNSARNAPWYSVKLVEDDMPDANQPDMQDWIQILQADPTMRKETDKTEIIEESTTEMSEMEEDIRAEIIAQNTPAESAPDEVAATSFDYAKIDEQDNPGTPEAIIEPGPTADTISPEMAIYNELLPEALELSTTETTMSAPTLSDTSTSTLEEATDNKTPLAQTSAVEPARASDENSLHSEIVGTAPIEREETDSEIEKTAHEKHQDWYTYLEMDSEEATIIEKREEKIEDTTLQQTSAEAPFENVAIIPETHEYTNENLLVEANSEEEIARTIQSEEAESAPVLDREVVSEIVESEQDTSAVEESEQDTPAIENTNSSLARIEDQQTAGATEKIWIVDSVLVQSEQESLESETWSSTSSQQKRPGFWQRLFAKKNR